MNGRLAERQENSAERKQGPRIAPFALPRGMHRTRSALMPVRGVEKPRRRRGDGASVKRLEAGLDANDATTQGPDRAASEQQCKDEEYPGR
jgi:hypothetical protein